jgi:peptidoglycan-N-acetylglucosamine deacetylase
MRLRSLRQHAFVWGCSWFMHCMCCAFTGLSMTDPPRDSLAVLVHGSRHEKAIALTFDACSTHQPSHYDERVTEILVRTQTPATIFLGGKWIEDFPDQARFLAKIQFFDLANHSYYHPHLKEAADSVIRTELKRTQDILFSITGTHATYFRAPYGEYDSRVVRIARELGLTTVEYDLPSGDPAIHTTKEKLVEYITSMTRNGSIIVMHINGRGWHTSEALPDIIARLKAHGFRFVTLTELQRLSRMRVP